MLRNFENDHKSLIQLQAIVRSSPGELRSFLYYLTRKGLNQLVSILFRFIMVREAVKIEKKKCEIFHIFYGWEVK